MEAIKSLMDRFTTDFDPTAPRDKIIDYIPTPGELENIKCGMSPANYTDFLHDFDLCPECGESKITVLFHPITKEIKRGRRQCACDRAETERKRQQVEHAERIRRLDELRKYSMMDERFYTCTFDRWESRENPDRLFNLCTNYVERWDDMQRENIGLFLYGGVGTGKTFASFCIANALMEKGVSVMAISMSGILEKIKSTFGDDKRSEADVIHKLKNADCLILDDLGSENRTEWAKEKMYEVIDSRYRSRKPIIITTNLPLAVLGERLKSEDQVSRIYDRIIEMCNRFEVTGTSRRGAIGRKKRSILDELTQSPSKGM